MVGTKRASAPGFPRLRGGTLAALYLGVVLLPLVLAAGRATAPLDPWEKVGAGLGLAALAAMVVQFVTSGRFGAVSGRLGIDRIMAFHKVAAWWVLAGLVLHPLFYVLPTWLEDPALGVRRLVAYHVLPHYRSGVIALAALALLVLTSALRERLPLRYEVWRASHVILGLAAAGLGLHHALTVGRFSALGAVNVWWWGVAGALVLVMGTLYGWRWLRLHRRPWRLASVTKLADRIWELDIRPARDTPELGYEAGQFVWMTVGGRRFPLFDHPFSIAGSPAHPGLRLIVKEAGDFTGGVGQLPPGIAIGIDGPYGEFSLGHHPGRAVLLIAGGAGIGPIMGLLRDMVARGDRRPVRMAYAAGRASNLACLPEIAAAREALDLRVHLVSEAGGEAAEGMEIETGVLDRARLRAVMAGLDPAGTVAMICGPGPMVAAVSDALDDLGLPMDRVIYERFDYAGSSSRQDRRHLRRTLALGAGLAAGVALFAALV